MKDLCVWEISKARKWYEAEAKREMWSFRTLYRNISTQYYERMLLSQIKDDVHSEMVAKTSDFQNYKFAYIKSPTVLEFLGLPASSAITEPELESAILYNIEELPIHFRPLRDSDRHSIHHYPPGQRESVR